MHDVSEMAMVMPGSTMFCHAYFPWLAPTLAKYIQSSSFLGGRRAHLKKTELDVRVFLSAIQESGAWRYAVGPDTQQTLIYIIYVSRCFARDKERYAYAQKATGLDENTRAYKLLICFFARPSPLVAPSCVPDIRSSSFLYAGVSSIFLGRLRKSWLTCRRFMC